MSEKELTKEEKKKMLTGVISAINKKAGSVTVGYASNVAKPLTFVPMPSQDLNAMTGGGWPVGRITEVFGNNSSGKTSICIETIGEDMEVDPDSFWAWIESEESFDPHYAEKVHGVDMERLIYIDVTDEGSEAALDRLEVLVRTGLIKGFVVNSVAALSPKAEMEEDIGKQSIALQARMMSKLMRKWTALIGKNQVVAIFINQQRTDINSRFGDPNVTTGGRALSYYASLRFGMNSLKVQDTDPIDKEDGLKIGARVAKNRCVYDNPYKKCEFYVIFGEGVDKCTEVINYAPELNILRKSGSWFYYDDENGNPVETDRAIVDGKSISKFPLKFSGKSKLREFLAENKWFLDQLLEEMNGSVKRGEFNVAYQTEEELKDIEAIETKEKEFAKEIEDSKKPQQRKKRATPTDDK